MKLFTSPASASIATTTIIIIMFAAVTTARSAAFVARSTSALRRTISVSSTVSLPAKEGQAEVVLVGCGAPNRGMGWYHAVQMLDQKYVYIYIYNYIHIVFGCCCYLLLIQCEKASAKSFCVCVCEYPRSFGLCYRKSGF